MLRDVARGGIAGVIAGTIVGGVGGRIAMSIAAILNPQAAGSFTEAGEVVGRFTLQGTLALMLFGGLGAGIAAGVLWVVISPWVPWTGARRAILVMPIAVALGSFFLIESGNRDFVILGPAPAILALLILLVALVGAAVSWLDEWLDRRLPLPGAKPGRALLAYAVVAVLGLAPLLFTFNAFFSASFADSPRPLGIGPALLVCGVATVILWASRVRTGRQDVPPAVLAAGRIGLVAAVVLGGWHLIREADRIFAL
ncbi:MAG: hypothetical protein ABI620_03680 [Chloroflexota bacterium]